MTFPWRIVQSDSTGSLNRDRCSSHRDSTMEALVGTPAGEVATLRKSPPLSLVVHFGRTGVA
jgi:hypothetical protein